MRGAHESLCLLWTGEEATRGAYRGVASGKGLREYTSNGMAGCGTFILRAPRKLEYSWSTREARRKVQCKGLKTRHTRSLGLVSANAISTPRRWDSFLRI